MDIDTAAEAFWTLTRTVTFCADRRKRLGDDPMTGLEQETQNGVRIHPIPPSAPGIGSSPEVFQRGNGDITNTDVNDETADHGRS